MGQKLQKRVRTSSATTVTDYQSGFHYENYGLKFFATAEGYVNVNAGRFSYIYNYTDHLGNVRLSYTSDRLLGVRVIEENNYYPFGLKHNGYNNISPPYSVYKYKFNGMELQDELGLNVYDFGARNYMPDLGRWGNIDPLAEQSRRWTPYNYAYNNPVYFIDPDGMQSMDFGSADFDGLDDLRITGSLSGTALGELQKAVGSDISLSMDSGGNVSYTQNTTGPLTEAATALTNVINDSSIQVNVTAENYNVTADGTPYLGGAFLGNEVTGEIDLFSGGNNIVKTSQEINPLTLSKIDSYYGKNGANTLHEVTESYQGGLISQKSGVSAPIGKSSIYDSAHQKATPQTEVFEGFYDAKGNTLYRDHRGNVPKGAKAIFYYVESKDKPRQVIEVRR